jgi:predicted O-methyltransferase YrrM
VPRVSALCVAELQEFPNVPRATPPTRIWSRIVRSLKAAIRPHLIRLVRRLPRAHIVWATVTPYEPPPSVEVGRVRLTPRVCVVADGDHPRFEVIRRSLSAALTTPRGMLADFLTYEGDASALSVRHDPYGEVLAEPVGADEDRARVALRPPYTHFLYHLVRELQPTSVLECGTGHGASGLHILAALEDMDHGTLHTVELDPVRRQLAQSAFMTFFPDTGRVRSSEGSFSDVLPELVASLAPVDLVFEDGPHTPQVTLEVFQHVIDFVRPDGVLVFDDVHHEMNELAWSQIRIDPRIAASLEINGRFGVCVRR